MRNYFFLITTLITVVAVSAGAQDSTEHKQMDQILAELRQLRTLIETRLSVQPQAQTLTGTQSQIQTRTVNFNVGNKSFLGVQRCAPHDCRIHRFQCPYCRRFHEQTFPDLKKDYIDSGKVRFYHMDLPIELHPNALLAAQAGRCAAEQRQFWAMHDRMLAKADRLELINLVEYAQEFGIDAVAFRQCVEGGKYRGNVQQEARDAMSMGARGTPAFVIGRSTPSGVEGELVIGAEPYGLFDKKLREVIQ